MVEWRWWPGVVVAFVCVHAVCSEEEVASPVFHAHAHGTQANWQRFSLPPTVAGGGGQSSEELVRLELNIANIGKATHMLVLHVVSNTINARAVATRFCDGAVEPGHFNLCKSSAISTTKPCTRKVPRNNRPLTAYPAPLRTAAAGFRLVEMLLDQRLDLLRRSGQIATVPLWVDTSFVHFAANWTEDAAAAARRFCATLQSHLTAHSSEQCVETLASRLAARRASLVQRWTARKPEVPPTLALNRTTRVHLWPRMSFPGGGRMGGENEWNQVPSHSPALSHYYYYDFV